MGVLDKLFTRNHPAQVETEQRSYDEPVFGLALQYNGYGTYKTNQSMALSAVNRCVTVIMNGVSSLPVRLYVTDDDGYKMEIHSNLSYILSKRPNDKMNSFTFYSLIVKDILLSGNAYALIIKDGSGNVTSLQYIQPGFVNPIDKGDHVEYQITGVKGVVRSEDILHWMGYTDNGIYGVSVLTHARRTLGIADYGEKASENFFKSGGCTSGFLKFTTQSNSKQKEEVLSAWMQATGGPNNGPNGIPVLPMNVDYTQLSVNPADAQLLESRQFSVVEICRFFSVSPVKVFDLDHASYNNSEMAELSFLSDTLRPLLVKIESELETKLFPNQDNFDVKFDVSELLRTDKKSQAEYYTKLFQNGILTVNEIRKQLDLGPVEGGDQNCAQVNLTNIKNLRTINATADNRQKEEELNTNSQEEDDTKNSEE